MSRCDCKNCEPLPEPERPRWAEPVLAWDDDKKKYVLPCGHDARTVKWTCEICSSPPPARPEARRWWKHGTNLTLSRTPPNNCPDCYEVMEILTCVCGHEQYRDHAFGEGYCDVCEPIVNKNATPDYNRFEPSCRQFRPATGSGK
jgi:hypothetical protein